MFLRTYGVTNDGKVLPQFTIPPVELRQERTYFFIKFGLQLPFYDQFKWHLNDAFGFEGRIRKKFSFN